MNAILRHGLAFAITIAVGYAACALIFLSFPEASATFMNSLFHGLDFRRLQPAGGGFDFAGFAAAGAVLTGWAFLLGCLFKVVQRWLASARLEPRLHESHP